MTPPDELTPLTGGSGWNEETELDGHTIEELSSYLDAGREPLDPSIESSPGCQIALASMARLRALSASLLEAEAGAEHEQPRGDWVASILRNIDLESRSGRRIPISHPDPGAELGLTEGAVLGLVRDAGDSVGGVLIGRCRLEGDVRVPGEPIRVLIDATAMWGEPMHQLGDRVRAAIFSTLTRHTELNLVDIVVTIHDVHYRRAPEIADDRLDTTHTGELDS